ncbi:S41 family peptidase [Deinococcus apachensis]|uniref:S41 family peptidase n=1 Tax=Deinococcus apachensis TaxID=309886 RepID=UPI000368FFBC|nr:S41 family peptidase [Deinococcus apachensis]
MKRGLFLATVLLLGVGAPTAAQTVPSSPEATIAHLSAMTYLDKALAFIEQNALKRNTLDWPQVRAQAAEQAKDAMSTADTYPVIRLVLDKLNDHHSRFYTPEEARALERGQRAGLGITVLYPEGTVAIVRPNSPAATAGIQVGDTIEAMNGQPLRADVLGLIVEFGGDSWQLRVKKSGQQASITMNLGAASVSENTPPEGRRLPGDVGYLQLPMHIGDGTIAGQGSYAELAQGLIRRIDETPTCGWIVDLRRNRGGNMWTMLAGVGPILGEGKLGSFIDAQGTSEWTYQKGTSQLGGETLSSVSHPYQLKRPSPPVAVLTSRLTASSGEMTTIAFRGRPDTRSFGEATRGIPTGNVSQPLSDGALLVLTGALSQDRSGRTYEGRIQPDQTVGTDWSQFGSEQDPAVRAARDWLSQQPGCRS